MSSAFQTPRLGAKCIVTTCRRRANIGRDVSLLSSPVLDNAATEKHTVATTYGEKHCHDRASSVDSANE